MSDLGQPSSFLALEGSEPVFSCDGEEIGKVAEVFADPGADIFDGIVVSSGVLATSRKFVEAELVEEIFERGVLLKIDVAAAAELPPAGDKPG